MLRPLNKVPATIPVFNLHEVLPPNVAREHLDEVELPDIDFINFEDVTLQNFLR